MRILIYTNDSPKTEEAARLVAGLGYASDTEVILLAVGDTKADLPRLQTSQSKLEAILKAGFPGLKRAVRYGHAVEQILLETTASHYDLAVIGEEVHHGLLYLRADSITHKLARALSVPLLVARNVPKKLGKILICSGAESPSLDTLRMAGRLLSHIGAEIGLLHVMSQVALWPDSLPDDLLDTAETAIQRGTREGQHLLQGIRTLRAGGVSGAITPHLRHGLVVDQVMAETEEGGYDLLVVGSHRQPGLSRLLEIMLEDIAGQLLARSSCSVLVA